MDGMKILFDGYWLSEGPVSNAMVQRQIIEAWSATFPEDEIYVAVRAAYKPIVGKQPNYLSVKYKRHAASLFFELPRLARKVKADAVLTHNFASPTLKTKPFVFIHDFIFMDHPKWFTKKELIYFWLMPLSSIFAKLLFTSSSTEALRIKRFLKRRVTATSLGIDPLLRDAIPRSPTPLLKPKEFMLTIGRLTERKNLVLTIESALDSGLVTRQNPIVVVGEVSGKFSGLSARVTDGLKSGSVLFLDNLGAENIAWLYLNCSNFLFFSLDEGYGLPAIEALYFGAPTKVSDISVFRELVGPNGVFANPRDPKEMTIAITTKSNNPASGINPPSWQDIVTKMRIEILRVL